MAYTADVQVGTHSIQANYSGWGGLNLKTNNDLDGTAYTAIRFWIKGEGDYLIRLKVNGSQFDFTITTAWQQMTVDLSEFGNPSLIESVVLQNRSSSSRTVYIDQIEFVSPSNLQQPHFTGLQEEHAEAQLSIYPNPTSNSIRLESKLPIMSEILLYDQMGKHLQTISIDDAYLANISLQDLPSGIYFLHIPLPAGRQIKRIIKQ